MMGRDLDTVGSGVLKRYPKNVDYLSYPTKRTYKKIQEVFGGGRDAA
jgi:hypothetical protein